MQTIGERLEEARKRKGISIREAAETTKIRSDYLQKFEANSFDLDLPPLYIRGFVRSYARFLDLDPEKFVAEFDSMQTSEGRAPRRDAREVYGRVDFTEGGEAAGRPALDQAMLLKYGLFGGGAIVLVLIVVLLFSLFSGRASPRTAAAAAAPANPVATAPADQEAAALAARRGAVLDDLRDADALRRAFVLREILGPPVALR